jgi:hypothetical protein
MSTHRTDQTNGAAPPLSPADLIGTWTLVSWIQRRGDLDIEPMGSAPVGAIVYTADGHVSVSIMRRDRPRMVSGDFVSADAAEKVIAFNGYLGYFGRYELQGGDVVHRISSASFPNWVGESQRRTPRLEGDLLSLQAAPRIVDGVAVSASLVWRKSVD